MVRGKAPSRHFHFELNFFDLNLVIEPVKVLQLMHQVYSGFFDAASVNLLSPSQPTLRTRSEPLGVSASPPSDKHSSTEPRDGSLCMDCGTIPSMYCSSGGFWLKSPDNFRCAASVGRPSPCLEDQHSCAGILSATQPQVASTPSSAEKDRPSEVVFQQQSQCAVWHLSRSSPRQRSGSHVMFYIQFFERRFCGRGARVVAFGVWNLGTSAVVHVGAAHGTSVVPSGAR